VPSSLKVVDCTPGIGDPQQFDSMLVCELGPGLIPDTSGGDAAPKRAPPSTYDPVPDDAGGLIFCCTSN
jgi:hypothetical protein